ncbi:unnamed protein product [Calypogeia fissa]
MDSTGMRLSTSSSTGNAQRTSMADAAEAAAGGITYLDYSRVHIVRPAQNRARSSLVGGGTLVPVEGVASDERMVITRGQSVRVRAVAEQAAEVCRNARQICVQNGNVGAERAALDALSLIDQIAATKFPKS